MPPEQVSQRRCVRPFLPRAPSSRRPQGGESLPKHGERMFYAWWSRQVFSLTITELRARREEKGAGAAGSGGHRAQRKKDYLVFHSLGR